MRKILFILMITLTGFVVHAQYTGYAAINDMAVFKTQFSAAAQKTNSIKSDFVQEKNLGMLAEKITSKGKFWFKKESLVRMEYNHPFQYLMIMNKDNVYVKDGQKENTVSAKSNKLFQQINKITVDCMRGTFLNNTDFKSNVFENKTGYLVELTPTAKGIKDLFKTIVIAIDKKDYSVNSIQMNEQSGDDTLIKFSNKELNTNIPDALFAIK